MEEQTVIYKGRILRDFEPCDHPGCLSHVSHPCEGCGRVAGRAPEMTGGRIEDQQFQVKAQAAHHNHCELSVSHNGYQWSSLVFQSNEEIRQVIQALRIFTGNHPPDSRENPSVLKKYILVKKHFAHGEYLVALQQQMSVSAKPDQKISIRPTIVAVYAPTGRGPFRDDDGEAAYEFEYQFVRVL